MIPLAKEIVCKDGLRLSVQASAFHYSTPRSDEGPYTTKKVGFINRDGKRFAAPQTWVRYADDHEAGRLSDVFGYVPVELIESFIAEHGGES